MVVFLVLCINSDFRVGCIAHLLGAVAHLPTLLLLLHCSPLARDGSTENAQDTHYSYMVTELVSVMRDDVMAGDVNINVKSMSKCRYIRILTLCIVNVGACGCRWIEARCFGLVPLEPVQTSKFQCHQLRSVCLFLNDNCQTW